MISFNQIPNANLVPFVFVEFDNANAVSGPQILQYRVLLFGQKLASGTATPDKLLSVSSVNQVKALAGPGSMLANMAETYFANNKVTETWILPLTDSGSGIPATGSITFTGSATAPGGIYLHIAGRPVVTAIGSGNAATTVASLVANAINADINLPVTALASTNSVTLTAKNAGEVGNTLPIVLNYYRNRELPAGITATITAMSGGTNNPNLANAIATLGDEWFNVMICPYTDATNLAALKAELAERWGPLRPIEGMAFAAADATVGALSTLGNGHNSPHVSIIGGYRSPTPAYEIASATAANVAAYGNIDPARPFQTLALVNVLAPPIEDRLIFTERNTLLFDGISTYKADNDGTVRIERLVTTYKTSSSGADDSSYRNVNTMLTLGYLRWDFRNHIMRKFPRHKLANDGTNFAPGQVVVTPNIAKSEAINKFQEWESIGLVEDADQFKKELIVERNKSDPDRLDFYLPPNLINQFCVAAVQIGFRQ